MPQTSAQTSSIPTQSWSDYIVSTYSSSISPTHDPDQYAPSATPIASPISPTSISMSPSSATTTSPWGPYTKSGRGGAGNFTWQSSSSATSPTHPDLESGIPPDQQQSSLSLRQKAAAETEAHDQAATLAHKKKPEYTHLGRGGAGNFTPSAEVAPPAFAPEATTPPASPRALSFSSGVDPYLAARSGYYGRGGAGNHDDSGEVEGARRRRREEEREREREELLRRQVEESVLAGMRRPEGAVTKGGKERAWERDMDRERERVFSRMV